MSYLSLFQGTRSVRKTNLTFGTVDSDGATKSLGALGNQSLGFTLDELRKRLQSFPVEYLKDKSPDTAGTYRRSLNEFERWVDGLGEGSCLMVPETILRYKRHLVEVRQLSEVSVSTYLTAIRQFCAYLVEIGRLAENPAKAIKGNRRPAAHSREALTAAEVERLLQTHDEMTPIDKRDVAIIYLMLYGGLSEIEVVRANLKDFDLTLAGYVLRVQGKGRRAKDRQVPVDANVVQKIEGYLAARGGTSPGQPLFVSHGHRSEGERLTTRSVRNRVSECLGRAGITRKGVTPHSLTHTAPLLWLERGMSPKEVHTRMRHGTKDTTQIYLRKQFLQHDPEELEEA